MTDKAKEANFNINLHGTLSNTPDKQERLRVGTIAFAQLIQFMSDDEPFIVPGLAPLHLSCSADFSGWNGAGLTLTDADIPQYRHEASDPPPADQETNP